MPEVEFRVTGVPVSAQAKSPGVKAAWREQVQQEAKKALGTHALLNGDMCVVVRVFSDEPLRPDLDNLTKPILDALEGVIFENDRVVISLSVEGRTLSEPFVIAGVSSVLTAGFESMRPFVYVRVTNSVKREVIA